MAEESNISDNLMEVGTESESILDESNAENDQEVVTMTEVLQNEQKLLDDANAVLGAIDDKKCTYSEGYMVRQALFSCLTCIPEAKDDFTKGAGICLACCYYCHKGHDLQEGHDLVELYTKRKFRCDCGNSKFPEGQICNLDASKTESNEMNRYNHNFSGLYCTCSRPYPDPEDKVEDEMIQCIICEDWYHSRHLNIKGGVPSAYAEMICEGCVDKHDFLLHYDGLCVSNIINISSEEELKANIELEELPTVSSESNNEGASKEAVNSTTDNETCKKPKMKSENAGTKFWADVDWRKNLCTCPECVKIYEEEEVLFLIELQDTVQCYEEKGKAKAEELQAKQEEDERKYLSSLSRVPLMEALAGYNDLKSNLMEYLKKFAENKKVVREEDIREFFQGLDAKKRQKCDMFSNCR